jgi:hypothetical protein
MKNGKDSSRHRCRTEADGKTMKIVRARGAFLGVEEGSEMRKRLSSQPSDGVLLRRFPYAKLHVTVSIPCLMRSA